MPEPEPEEPEDELPIPIMQPEPIGPQPPALPEPQEPEPQPIELSPEAQRVFDAVSPQLVVDKEGQLKGIHFDADSLERTISDIQRRAEVVALNSELLGLNVHLVSRVKSIEELQKMAHESMLFLMNKIPCRKPLGVE